MDYLNQVYSHRAEESLPITVMTATGFNSFVCLFVRSPQECFKALERGGYTKVALMLFGTSPWRLLSLQ